MYTVKTKGEKKVIEGSYIPNGYECKCKSCKFTIEVPSTSTEEQIRGLVDKVIDR